MVAFFEALQLDQVDLAFALHFLFLGVEVVAGRQLDHVPVVKIIDFGISKFTQGELDKWLEEKKHVWTLNQDEFIKKIDEAYETLRGKKNGMGK